MAMQIISISSRFGDVSRACASVAFHLSIGNCDAWVSASGKRSSGEGVVRVLIRPPRAGTIFTQPGALHQFVIQEPRGGGASTVALVLLQAVGLGAGRRSCS